MYTYIYIYIHIHIYLSKVPVIHAQVLNRGTKALCQHSHCIVGLHLYDF